MRVRGSRGAFETVGLLSTSSGNQKSAASGKLGQSLVYQHTLNIEVIGKPPAKGDEQECPFER